MSFRPFRHFLSFRFHPARLALFIFAVPSGATLLDEARQARAESVPEVAVQKLRSFLSAPDLPAEQRQAGVRELARRVLDSGQMEEALATIHPLAAEGDFDSRLLEARILAAAGKWTEAEPLYRALAELPDASVEAQVGHAECLVAVNRVNEATRVLEACVAAHPKNAGAALRLGSSVCGHGRHPRSARESLSRANPATPGEEKWKSYLEARLLLAEGQAASALALFEELRRNPSDASEALLFGAVLGSSAAHALLNGFDGADTVIEKFIQENPESHFLDSAFRQLDVVYAQQAHPSEGELRKWVAKSPARRASLAQYYLARARLRAKKIDRAAATLDQFVQNYPAHALDLRSAFIAHGYLSFPRRSRGRRERAGSCHAQRGERRAAGRDRAADRAGSGSPGRGAAGREFLSPRRGGRRAACGWTPPSMPRWKICA